MTLFFTNTRLSILPVQRTKWRCIHFDFMFRFCNRYDFTTDIKTFRKLYQWEFNNLCYILRIFLSIYTKNRPQIREETLLCIYRRLTGRPYIALARRLKYIAIYRIHSAGSNISQFFGSIQWQTWDLYHFGIYCCVATYSQRRIVVATNFTSSFF